MIAEVLSAEGVLKSKNSEVSSLFARRIFDKGLALFRILAAGVIITVAWPGKLISVKQENCNG